MAGEADKLLEWLRPDYVWWVLGAPLLLLVGLVGLLARKRALARLVSARHRLRFLPSYSGLRAILRVLLAAGAVFLLALSLLGPVRGYSLREFERKGLDLVFVVDTSRSMLVQDLAPDRLTRAKREIRGLLEELRGDRAALLAFAGDVRQTAPLTHDRHTLGAFVETLSTDDNTQGGTNIGAALRSALDLFDGRQGAHEAIVLITDGEDLEEEGLNIAEQAAETGIKVFVLGMGTVEGGKIPAGRGFVRDETGSEVVSKLESKTLRDIAEASGGTYLSARDAAFPLLELYEKRITELEAANLWAGKLRVPHDRYQWPLVLAVICMLLEVGLREKSFRLTTNKGMGR